MKNGNSNSISLSEFSAQTNPQYKRPAKRATQPPPREQSCLSSKQCTAICVVLFIALFLVIIAIAGYAVYSTGNKMIMDYRCFLRTKKNDIFQ